MDPRQLTPEEREQLRRPKNVETVIRSKSGAYVVYLYSERGDLLAKGYQGKAIKPAFHYRYGSAEKRAANVSKWVQGIESSQRAKASRRRSGHTLKVGDVLSAHWGYEQTNIDYYQVTALIGSSMVEIRRIGCQVQETGYMRGESVPAPGSFIGGPMRKVARDNGVRITSYAWASRIEPIAQAGSAKVYRAESWTSYA